MSCQKCKSERLVSIQGKTSDMFDMNYKDKSGHGYVPANLFFGKDHYGDYMHIEFCADCGQIQAKFPISESTLKTAMSELDDN